MTSHPSLPRPLRLLGAALALVVVLSGCSNNSGPGSEEDLTKALTREGGFADAEAACITSAVFDRYSTDEEALKKISRATTYDELIGADGVEGFGDFLDNAVDACTGN